MITFVFPGNRARLAGAIAIGFATVFVAGCKKDLEGPAPAIDPPSASAEPPPVDPGLVCRAQLETEVTLHGADFSPVPIDVPDAPKVALPKVTLTRSHELDGDAVSSPDEVVYSGNPDPATDPTNVDLLFWKSREEMSFLVNQEITLADGDEGMLEEGVWDVTIESPAGDVTESAQSLAVIDKPTLDDVAPGITCLAQGARTIDLTGRQFLRNGSDEAVLAVEGVSEPFAITRSDCTPIAHEGLDAEVCNAGSVELGEGSIDAGFPALTVQNPATAACASEDDVKLRVVPPPTIDRVEPPLGCVVEEARSFTVEGADFLYVDGEPPVITVGGMDVVPDDKSGCETVDAQGHDVERCASLTFTIAQGQLDPELYEVVVTNPEPAGCDATATGALRLVPPPTLDAIAPPLVCVDDSAREVVLTGADILVVDGTKPEITLDGDVLDPDRIVVDESSCEGLSTDRLDVQRCTTLVLTLVEDGVGVGMPEVTLTNPAPAGCSDTRADLLTVAPGPSISGVVPALACSEDGARQLTIEGEGFLKVGTVLPSVTIDGNDVQSVDSAGGCSAVVVNGLDVETCTSVVVTVAQGGLAESTRPEISLTNPDPAGCNSTTSEVVTVPPFLAVASLSPLNVCVGKVDSAFEITVAGEGFLRVDGADFAVTAGGNAVTPTDISTCEDLTVAGFDAGDVQSCGAVTGTFDLTAGMTATAGTIPVVVSNAVNAPGCPLVAMTDLHVVDPPSITAIDIQDTSIDDEVCSEISFVVTVVGTGFVEGATARFVNDTMTIVADDVTVLSDTAIEATFSEGLPYDASDPLYDFIVENAGDCASNPLMNAVEVNPTPIVFFVDPPVVYNEVGIDVTVFTANLTMTSTLDTIEIVGPDPATDATELTVVSNPKPNRIVANIPGEDGNPTFASGEYSIRVTSVLGCSGELPGALTITDTLQPLLLSAIAPSYVSPTVETAVTVNGSGFVAVPRLYLTPASGTGTATALRAVELQSAAQLTAVIQGGITAGDYDLVAVNPNGDVDVLDSAVTVTAGEPPVIDSVVPASLRDNDAAATVTLRGNYFDTGTAPAIELDCQSGMTVVGTAVATPDATTATVTFDASPLTAGDVCLVRLTNPDGAFFEYSAVSLTNSSLNLSGWTDATSMSTGRRGPVLVAGRPTNTSRFLYTVGGDAGTMNAPLSRGTVLTSVESASLDPYGDMGTWALQRNDLLGAIVGGTVTSSPRTQAGSARIGRFAYLVGGHDGTTATSTVLRAQILDPLAAPAVEELDAVLGDPGAGTGLDEGLYYYRIAAIFPSNDVSNPTGESLPGELFPVQLPATTDGIVLTLTWEEVEGARGYRVYRSPAAGAAADAVELLAEVTCGGPTATCDCGTNPTECQYEDDGTGTTTAETPMPSGSLGVWHAIDGTRCADANCALATAREGLATVAVRDRVEADPATDVWYLYAFGGRDGSGTYQSGFEVATVTVTLAAGGAPESHSVADWAAGANAFLSPRADLAAWVMKAEESALIRGSGSPDAVWIYVGGGRTTGGANDGTIGAALVQPGGNLGAWIADGDVTGLVGLGPGASNDQLYTFGGTGSADGSSTTLCGSPQASGGGCSGGVSDPPDLQNFNALGGAGAVDRMFMGHTQESAFFFLVGGHDGVSAVSTTEQTVQ